MRLDASPLPLTSTEGIRAACEDAELPPLLAAVAHVTGDRSILRPEHRPDPLRLLEPEYGVDPAQFSVARDNAAAALTAWVEAGAPAPEPLTPEAFAEIVAYVVGDDAAAEYVPLLAEELALDGTDPRAPRWHADEVAPDRTFEVVIVGAGMSGIVVAHRLQQAGVPFVILEKNDDVGGTWYENTYPGCRVDVPSHLYSYSFAQTPAWPQFFATQPILRDYFDSCVDALDLRPHIRFGVEVVSADLDDATQRWTVRTRDHEGLEGTLEVDAVISAVGQLNRPRYPDIAGLDTFAGTAFHSARWPAAGELDLAGRKVAVIGTGASAMQLIPSVAEQVGADGHLTVFQRTPAWLLPNERYHEDIPNGLRLLLDHVPDYVRWDRLWLFWRLHESLLPTAVVDPEWPGANDPGAESISLMNEFVRQVLVDYVNTSFADDPELAAAVTPHYPPIAKRVVIDNGTWARTLLRDHVDLVTTGIAEIEPEGVRTADGVLHEADVIIYGTGFTASDFLTPMRVRGTAGADLHERWGGDARAFLGVTIPDFPNLFLLYGPNTNIVINGSIIYFSECGAHYIVEAIRLLLEGGHRSLDCRPDVHDAFNAEVDAANRTMAWGASNVNSWYKNATGRVAQNWPYPLIDYWRRTRHPDPDHYVLR